MLRWLPVRLRRLYERIVAARPHTRARPVPPIPPEPPPSGGRERKFRLEVVQDAFCHGRPAPRRLFRTAVPPRDMTSWCDEPHRTTGRHRPRCPSCDHARTLYRDAVAGDEEADRRLYRLARRGAVRLLAERRKYRADRRDFLARKRADEAVHGKPEMPLHFLPDLWELIAHRGSVDGGFHVRDRRDVERGLVRDHAALLRVLLRRRCARLGVLARAPARRRPRRPTIEPNETVGLSRPPARRPAVLRGQPGEHRRHEPGASAEQRHESRGTEIERGGAGGVAQHLQGGLASGPARPDHAGAAIPGGVTHPGATEDARDHVAVHRDIAEPAVGDLHVGELGQDVQHCLPQRRRRPVRVPRDRPVAAAEQHRVPSGEGR